MRFAVFGFLSLEKFHLDLVKFWIQRIQKPAADRFGKSTPTRWDALDLHVGLSGFERLGNMPGKRAKNWPHAQLALASQDLLLQIVLAVD